LDSLRLGERADYVLLILYFPFGKELLVYQVMVVEILYPYDLSTEDSKDRIDWVKVTVLLHFSGCQSWWSIA